MHASCAAWQIAGIFDRQDGEDRPAFFPREAASPGVPFFRPLSFSLHPVVQSAPPRERKASAVKEREGKGRGQGGDTANGSGAPLFAGA